jgi:NAD(P)H-dependent flavin oxidoreductase YrpB (nitropropane dioxygenase family)
MTPEDMKKAFSMGAKGVQIGTLFAATEESNGADNLKEVYVRATKEDIVLIDSPVGLKGQAIRNEFTEKIARGEATPKACYKCLKKCTKNFCIMVALNNAQQGNLEEGLIFSGQH